MSRTRLPTPWIGLDSDFDLSPYAGFIYQITELDTGCRYIGKKVFWFKRKKKVKGQKRKKRVTTESDWKQYRSSSKTLKALIDKRGLDKFEFRILKLCKTKAQINFSETEALFKNEVLHATLPNGKPMFFNDNILGRYYRGKV